jgi:hypothetical protein
MIFSTRLLWRRLYERRGAFDSAVIDSRYKPARQREPLGGSTSGLTHSSAAKRRFFWIERRLTPRKWVNCCVIRGKA